MNDPSSINAFNVKDCALAAIATGFKAQTLLDLRDKLEVIPPSSIYFHFWGGRLRTSFEHREYHNDFSDWAHRGLHDDILAERLEIINPKEYSNVEDIRAELIEIIDDRLDEREIIPWAKSDEQFHFILSTIIVFQTRHFIQKPSDLIHVIPKLSHSSLFYHFIDSARRVPDGIDDFSAWLQPFPEYQELIAAFRKIDPYLISLAEIKKKLMHLTSEFFL